jgi:hypothetical protein
LVWNPYLISVPSNKKCHLSSHKNYFFIFLWNKNYLFLATTSSINVCLSSFFLHWMYADLPSMYAYLVQQSFTDINWWRQLMMSEVGWHLPSMYAYLLSKKCVIYYVIKINVLIYLSKKLFLSLATTSSMYSYLVPRYMIYLIWLAITRCIWQMKNNIIFKREIANLLTLNRD